MEPVKQDHVKTLADFITKIGERPKALVMIAISGEGETMMVLDGKAPDIVFLSAIIQKYSDVIMARAAEGVLEQAAGAGAGLAAIPPQGLPS